ncbi:MAG: hypothetical protein JWM68_953 [Verrucomicrobiales bacterium]|nr:hypothetical protein [Verrucomicrobiales bacterium]
MSRRTYKIALYAFLAIALVNSSWLAFVKFNRWREKTRITAAKESFAKRRASESNAVSAKVEARQKLDETLNAKRIDLSDYINAPLTASFAPKQAKANNLSELNEGVQTLAGVPFDIKGTIQLSGRDLRIYSNTNFPLSAKGIAVSNVCTKLHILHGSYFVKKLGITIARLELHYSDGTTEALPIVSGEHVLDWWAPNYQTGVKEEWQNVSAEGSELAWVGSNDYIKRRQSHLSLRLFKSTFINPRPSLTIETIDYISADTAAAPFLLGLTVE